MPNKRINPTRCARGLSADVRPMYGGPAMQVSMNDLAVDFSPVPP